MLVDMVDLNSVDSQELIECVGRCSGVVLMTPPSSGAANSLISTLYAAVKPKQVCIATAAMFCTLYLSDGINEESILEFM
jgi:flavorubredoxin